MEKEKLNFVVRNEFQFGTNRVSTSGSNSNEPIVGYLKWRSLIDYINSTVDDSRHLVGKDIGAYYGLSDGEMFSCSYDSTYESLSMDLISIDDAIAMLGLVVGDAEDYFLDQENRIHRIQDTVEVTSDYSMYFGQRIPISESVSVAECYGGGIARRSECSRDNQQDWFVESSADDYDLVYSDYNGCYINRYDDDVIYGIINTSGNDGYFISDDYVRTEDTDDYFADQDIAYSMGCYYDSDSGEWYRERNDVRTNNASYHSQHRATKCDLSRTKFRVGFEVEKEDEEAGLINYEELYNETQWCKESDGSLDSSSGYELVSPTYDLFSNDIDNDINSSSKLKELINGDYSDSCGGHINLSSNDFNPYQLFEGLSGFYPLLYTMYQHRLEGGYCKAKSKHRYYDSDKYSAIYIKNFLVEFRIFPAVTSVSNLLWRRDLIRIMCKNINADEMSVLKMMTSQSSDLYKHLRKIYTQDQIIDRISLFIKYADQYGNKKIYPPTKRIDNLKNKKDNLPDADGMSNELGA